MNKYLHYKNSKKKLKENKAYWEHIHALIDLFSQELKTRQWYRQARQIEKNNFRQYGIKKTGDYDVF